MSGRGQKFTAFDYLLNRFELASQADRPSEFGYAEKRADLLAYVEALRDLADARDSLYFWIARPMRVHDSYKVPASRLSPEKDQ